MNKENITFIYPDSFNIKTIDGYCIFDDEYAVLFCSQSACDVHNCKIRRKNNHSGEFPEWFYVLQ
jgi:hypothetical protein